MTLKVIKRDFTVCKIKDLSEVDFEDEFCFIGKTDEEISCVCETSHVPNETIHREDGFWAFRIEGILDFSLVGILSKISTVLADGGISVFVVSTFHTDYFFVKKEVFHQAYTLLEENGFQMIS